MNTIIHPISFNKSFLKIFQLINLLLVIIFLCNKVILGAPENPGQFKAGWINVNLNRDGRAFNAIIYYPARNEGSGAQIDTTAYPYPVIAFGHGFAMQISYYTSLFKHLSSHGFIVIAPQFPDVSHLQLAYDLIFCLNYIKSQNSNPQSIFYKKVDVEKMGLSGHSMGGGASLLASGIDTTISVVAPLAAAETNPSAINSMNKIKSIVYLITAQSDGITPPSTNQIPMYNNAFPIKAIPTIKGANHTKFMDTRIWDWTDPRGYLSASEQLRITRRYLTSIFSLFLKEDTSYFKFAFGDDAQNDTSIILQSELKPLNPKKFNLLFPKDTLSSFQNFITFQWESTYSLNLYDSIRYRLVISRDSLFNSLYRVIDSLNNNFINIVINDTGRYFWKAIAYTSDITFTESETSSFTLILSDIKDEGLRIPNFELKQNYPNPFNNKTKISFSLSEYGFTSLKIYDTLGRELKSFIDTNLFPNHNYEIDFSADNLKSGVYFIKLSQNKKQQIRKMVLVK